MFMKKQVADFICFVGGVFIIVYFVFDFGHEGSWGDASPGYYCYSAPSRFGLALGASLICLGLLRRWKREQQ
jgi:hypothetical protein